MEQRSFRGRFLLEHSTSLLRQSEPRGATLTQATKARIQDSGGALGRWRMYPASGGLLEPMYGPQWLAIGDAAMHFDPLWGQGLGYALTLGLRGSEAAALPARDHADVFAMYEQAVRERWILEGKRRKEIYERARAGIPRGSRASQLTEPPDLPTSPGFFDSPLTHTCVPIAIP